MILDLEDSVPAAEKTAALEHVINFLSKHNRDITAVEIWVRVNNRPGLLEEELTALAGLGRLSGITLPKIENRIDKSSITGTGPR